MGIGGSRPRNRDSRRYAMVIDLAVQGIASLLIGVGLGWWLKESYGAPDWVMLICIMLGIAAAVLTMVRYQRRLERLDEDAQGEEERSGPAT